MWCQWQHTGFYRMWNAFWNDFAWCHKQGVMVGSLPSVTCGQHWTPPVHQGVISLCSARCSEMGWTTDYWVPTAVWQPEGFYLSKKQFKPKPYASPAIVQGYSPSCRTVETVPDSIPKWVFLPVIFRACSQFWKSHNSVVFALNLSKYPQKGASKALPHHCEHCG